MNKSVDILRARELQGTAKGKNCFCSYYNEKLAHNNLLSQKKNIQRTKWKNNFLGATQDNNLAVQCCNSRHSLTELTSTKYFQDINRIYLRLLSLSKIFIYFFTSATTLSHQPRLMEVRKNMNNIYQSEQPKFNHYKLQGFFNL